MRLLIVTLIGSVVTGCSSSTDASREQLTAAIAECRIARPDVRPGAPGQTRWVWHWSYDDGVENQKMNCVRDVLSRQNLKADFVDRSVTNGNQN